MPRPPAVLRAATLLTLVAPLFVSSLRGEELLPPERPMAEVVDHYLNVGFESAEVTPAPLVADELLVRRTTLDLAGRIPTVAEVRDYVASPDPGKRAALVDRLMSGPDFELHLRNELDALLSPADRHDDAFRAYLAAAVSENRPWDRVFRELMLGTPDVTGEEQADKGAARFLSPRADRPDDMTNDTSKIFFGVSINCAQCHDHPLVDDWKQDHYFGMQSFFKRTYVTKAGRLAERPTGEVKFKTTAGEEKKAAFMFLSGEAIAEPADARSEEQIDADEEETKRQMKEADAPPPTPPAFQPRAELVALALSPQNRQFLSRALVNRVWARLMGRGLVDPPDQLHSANPPTHPELLDWLARDTENYGFDLKRLIRGVILTDAYARSSRWDGTGDPPWEGRFAVYRPKPLTPRQYGLSLVVAGRAPGALDPLGDPAAWRERRRQLEGEGESYARHFEPPGRNFQVSVDEALYLCNDPQVQNDLLRDGGDRLVGHLKTLPDPAAQVTTAYRTILIRDPDAEELAAAEAFLAARSDRQLVGLQQLVWALAAGPELRFNY